MRLDSAIALSLFFFGLQSLETISVLADHPRRPSVHVVVFLSTRCPCSQSHEPILKTLYEKYRTHGVTFEGVHSNQDETAHEAAQHFSKARVGFEVHHDKGAQRANALGALKTPHAFVFSDSKLVYHGGIDNSQLAEKATENFLEPAIEAALEGRVPQIPEARALGCIIRR